MSSIVLELQRECLDESRPVPTLLRKAKLISQKLNILELTAWADGELRGYGESTNIPMYRELTGEIKCWNPYNGIIMPIIFKGKTPKELTTRKVHQSIAELCDLLNRDKRGELTIPFPDTIGVRLMELSNVPTPPVLVIDRAQVVGIIDKVRSLILDWTVKLETEGILGNGMAFTTAEKDKIMKDKTVFIQNFQGVLGDVNQSTVTQNLNMTISKGSWHELKTFLESKGIAGEETKTLYEALTQDAPPTSPTALGPKVSSWIGRMLTKAADGTWQVGIGVAGNLLATSIGKYYGF